MGPKISLRKLGCRFFHSQGLLHNVLSHELTHFLPSLVSRISRPPARTLTLPISHLPSSDRLGKPKPIGRARFPSCTTTQLSTPGTGAERPNVLYILPHSSSSTSVTPPWWFILPRCDQPIFSFVSSSATMMAVAPASTTLRKLQSPRKMVAGRMQKATFGQLLLLGAQQRVLVRRLEQRKVVVKRPDIPGPRSDGVDDIVARKIAGDGDLGVAVLQRLLTIRRGRGWAEPGAPRRALDRREVREKEELRGSRQSAVASTSNPNLMFPAMR